MGKSLVHFGHEKPIINLHSYGMFKSLIPNNFVVLLPSHLHRYHDSIDNTVFYKESWSNADKTLFYNYLLIKNFITRRNKSLNFYLRVSLFSTDKIRNQKTLFFAIKHFFRTIVKINPILVFKIKKLNSEKVLEILRERKILKSNNTDCFLTILETNQITKVFIITTFTDPGIFDLIKACNLLGIPSYVLPESWDNISTAIAIPSDLTELLVWSQQQHHEVKRFFEELSSRTKIIGSYRITKAIANQKIHTSYQAKVKGEFKILYVEGYFLEDVNFILNRLIKVLAKIPQLKNTDIKIVYRKYPLEKQTNKFMDPVKLVGDSKLGKIRFLISENNSLIADLELTDLVISESTTAGLEASFTRKPVIFISSKKSKKFIDTRRSYLFSYSNDLEDFFYVINFEDRNSDKLLTFALMTYIGCDQGSKDINRLNLTYFGEPFNFSLWSELID